MCHREWRGIASPICRAGRAVSPARVRTYRNSWGEVKVFRLADGRPVVVVPEAHTDGVLGAAFSPDGSQLAGPTVQDLRDTVDDRGQPVLPMATLAPTKEAI